MGINRKGGRSSKRVQVAKALQAAGTTHATKLEHVTGPAEAVASTNGITLQDKDATKKEKR